MFTKSCPKSSDIMFFHTVTLLKWPKSVKIFGLLLQNRYFVTQTFQEQPNLVTLIVRSINWTWIRLGKGRPASKDERRRRFLSPSIRTIINLCNQVKLEHTTYLQCDQIWAKFHPFGKNLQRIWQFLERFKLVFG